MKKLILSAVVVLAAPFAMAEPDDGTMIYRAYAPTIEEAQVVVDGINANEIKACRFSAGYDTKQKAYSVVFPSSGTTTHINKYGKIVMMQSKTLFKVKCDYRDND